MVILSRRAIHAFAKSLPLEQEGKLLAMYWSVSKFNNGLRQLLIDRTTGVKWSDTDIIENELKVITLFTIMCRWLLVLSQQETSWIREIRTELNHLNMNVVNDPKCEPLWP
jgi:hypothetical protein